jgi:uncharacterized membrane protein YfcA
VARGAAHAGAGASLLALGPALAGMALGGWLRARVRPETFRLCFFLGLLALGAELVWRGAGVTARPGDPPRS